MSNNNSSANSCDSLLKTIENVQAMQEKVVNLIDTAVVPDSSHSASSYLAQLRVLRETVNAFNKTVDEKAIRLKEECWDNILVRGIAELPDELLALVFELAYDNDSEGSRLAIQLSHVCRRFRAIALHTPRLWSTLAASQRSDEYQTFISRSRTADLTIIVDYPFRNCSYILLADFINNLSSLANRWGEFQFHCGPMFVEEWEAFRELTDINLVLPRLHTLAVFGCHERWNWDYWSHWDMPGLRHFESYNAIPTRLDSTSLVSCDLEFGGFRFTGMEINGLLVVLQACPALQTLALDFVSIDKSVESSETEVALLGQLKTMTIHIAGMSKSGTIRPIIRNIVMPCLERIDYDIEMNDDLEPKTFLTNIFPPMPHCHNLRSVHMKVETFECDFQGINTVFSSFPQIHHLHLEAPLFGHVTYPASAPEGTFPPLRSLSLKNCMLLSDKYGLGHMLEAMHIHGRYWDRLERIEVIGNSDAPAMQLYDSIEELVKGFLPASTAAQAFFGRLASHEFRWMLCTTDFRRVRKTIIRDLSALEINSENIHLIEREESISCITRKTSGLPDGRVLFTIRETSDTQHAKLSRLDIIYSTDNLLWYYARKAFIVNTD